MIRIVSWNINSIRFRMYNIAQLVKEYNPDIICLQETKVVNELFPVQDIIDLGYPHIFFNGQAAYHGVATFSKYPMILSDVNWSEMGHARNLSVVCKDVEIHNLYIPAGGDIPDPDLNPKFAHKLEYLDHIYEYFTTYRKSTDKMIMLGDFNVAPFEHDVWSHKQLLKVVSHTPIEVEKLNRLKTSNDWQDIARIFTDHNQKLYTWWSYRNQNWEKSDRGRRLDHIWTTPQLAKYVSDFKILKHYRNHLKTSDHVPLYIDIKLD